MENEQFKQRFLMIGNLNVKKKYSIKDFALKLWFPSHEKKKII